MMLDAFQAGLSWRIILHKRENFRLVFDNFDAEKIEEYNDKKINELLNNKGIIRNRLKTKATIINMIGMYLIPRRLFETTEASCGIYWLFFRFLLHKNLHRRL